MDVNKASASDTPSITPELKQSIIDMLLAKKSVSFIATEYSISKNTLYQWRKNALLEKDHSMDKPPLTMKELIEQNARLREENLLLRQKEFILKKAVLILGENTK
jgi:transposase-like protein